MLKTVKHFFETHIAFTSPGESEEEKLQVASAALLMDMLYAEKILDAEKRDLTLSLLKHTYNLNEQQAADLMALSEQRMQQATDYFEFTHLINKTFEHEQKVELIESLWKIALIDHHLAIDEEYLVNKIGGLLHLSGNEVLAAKQRAQRALPKSN